MHRERTCEDIRRTDIGYALSGLIGLGISAVGTRFLVSPEKAAAAYGVSVGKDVSAADPYLSTKGVRDVASGLMTFVLIAARKPHALAGFMLDRAGHGSSVATWNSMRRSTVPASIGPVWAARRRRVPGPARRRGGCHGR